MHTREAVKCCLLDLLGVRLSMWFDLALTLTGSNIFAQSSVSEIPYESVPHFLKLPPDLYLGEVAGVGR